MKYAFPKKITKTFNNILSVIQNRCCSVFGPGGDLKVLSFLVAAIMFSLIRTTIGFTDTFPVPVKVAVKAPGVAIRDQEASEVEVTLKGANEDIQKFDPSNLDIEVVINEVDPDVEFDLITLRRNDVKGVGKLRVRSITPDSILVNYDREVTTRLKLALPQLVGQPLLGKASISLKVADVIVTGPDSKLKLLRERNFVLPTESVDVNGKTQNFTKKIRVLPPADSGISSVTPSEVEAEIEIVSIPVESIYTNEPPIILSADESGLPLEDNGDSATGDLTSHTNKTKSAEDNLSVPSPETREEHK
jgi:hypothetical protein